MKSPRPWVSDKTSAYCRSGTTYCSVTYPRSYTQGFSFIEVIIVVALVALIAGFGMSFSVSTVARVNASSERDFFVSLITQARTRSLANINEKPHGVYIDIAEHRYITYSGADVIVGTDKTLIPMTSNATVAGPQDFSFAQLSAHVSPTQVGTTTITLAEQAYAVNVNTFGRIDW